MDVTERLKLHTEASAERDKWARKAIDLLAEGKDRAGMAAAKKAKQWDEKAKSLTPAYRPRSG
jgi:hypothetical protein